jgi:predicted Zn-dependent peptidase
MSGVDRTTLPVPGPTGVLRFPTISRRTLANGLEIRAVTHATVPVVCAVLLVRAGTSADPLERPGLAAFTGDLLDEGSGGRSALEVADELARRGADLDVDVGPDATVISLTTLTRFMSPALALMSEMATSPNLAAPDVERVRKLRLERLQQLRDHAPAVADRAFMRLLYRDHPYGHLGLGSPAALAATTIGEIRDFHQRGFVPRAATLVITGDAEPDALLDAAAAAFDAWPGGDATGVDWNAALQPPPSAPDQRLAIVDRPGAAQSEMRIGHVCASRSTPDYHALVVLNTILGGQFVSRVNMKLRQEKGYTYGVRTGFDLRRGLGPFALQTSVDTKVTAAAVSDALGEIEDIRGPRPATPDELSLGKASVTLGYPRGFETAQQVARGVAQLALHELPDSYFQEFVPKIDAVGLDDVQRVARQYLETAKMTTLVVGDAERAGGELAALLGEPLRISITDSI